MQSDQQGKKTSKYLVYAGKAESSSLELIGDSCFWRGVETVVTECVRELSQSCRVSRGLRRVTLALLLRLSRSVFCGEWS